MLGGWKHSKEVFGVEVGGVSINEKVSTFAMNDRSFAPETGLSRQGRAPTVALVLLGECRCHLEHSIVEKSILSNDHIHGLYRIANSLEAVLNHFCFIVVDSLEKRRRDTGRVS